MNTPTDVEKVYDALVTAYADLWAQYHCLIRAIGMSGAINDGRLAVDAQIAMEQEGRQLVQQGRERLEELLRGRKSQ